MVKGSLEFQELKWAVFFGTPYTSLGTALCLYVTPLVRAKRVQYRRALQAEVSDEYLTCLSLCGYVFSQNIFLVLAAQAVSICRVKNKQLAMCTLSLVSFSLAQTVNTKAKANVIRV